MKYLMLAAALVLAAGPSHGAAPTRQLQPSAPAQQDALAAAAALEQLDPERIVDDRAYAQEMLRHIDLLMPSLPASIPEAATLQGLRALILAELDRSAEAREAVDQLLRRGFAEPQPYVMAWAAASHISDVQLMVRSVEGLAQRIPSADRDAALAAFAPDMMFPLDRLLKERGLEGERVRLSEALVAMNWSERDDPAAADYFRKHLLDHRLSQGRREDAARLATQIRTPSSVLPLLTLRRYDGLLASGGEELAAFQRLLAETDRRTAAATARPQADAQALVERMEFLRSAGRNQEALDVVRSQLADIPATVAHDRQGMWIVNHAAYALMSLGRPDEALALMARLVSLDMTGNSDLIGPSINYAALLWQAGRNTEALAHVERLRPLAAEHANDYGRMWIAAHAACANLALNRASEAATQLRKLKERPDVNTSALNQALLCAGDLDSSEREMIRRLHSDDAENVVRAFQNFSIDTSEGAPLDTLRRRLLEVRERPAVRAALDRVARVLTLPAARTYHGTF